MAGSSGQEDKRAAIKEAKRALDEALVAFVNRAAPPGRFPELSE
jgi:hypothetical protein